MALQHLRSSTADKRPTPAAMSDGQLALNTNLASPGLFFKDSNGDSVKIGPVHVGTTAPNVTPGAGGQVGNSKGEQWLDTSSSRYVFKIWDGTAWRSEDGEFVNTSGDTMTGALGIVAGTAAAPGVFFSGDTNTGIYSPGADTLAFAEGGVEAARIDSGGRLLVGTSSVRNVGSGFQTSVGSHLFIEQPSTGLTPATFLLNRNDTNGPRIVLGKSRGTAVGSNTIVANDDELGRFDFAGADGTDLESFAAQIRVEVDGTPGANAMPGRIVLSTTAAGAATPTERMRIKENGNTWIGTTTDLTSDQNKLAVSGTRAIVGRATGGAASPVITAWNNATSGDNYFVSFRTETADVERGVIDYNRAAGLVRYNVTSDRRLKSAIQPATSAVNLLSSIQVRSYKWTETGYTIDYGFIAQELNQVLPDAVKVGDDGEEITDTWAVDNSKVVPLLTKALQEALAKIETLEARLTAAGIE